MVKMLGCCRGDGKLYVKLKLKGIKQVSGAQLVARAYVPVANAAHGTKEIPAGLYPFLDGSYETPLEGYWVLELPLLETRQIRVQVCSLNPNRSAKEALLHEFTVDLERAKWESRLNYRLRKRLCASIRDYEQNFLDHQYQPRIRRFLEGNDSVVWRMQVRWKGDAKERPRLSAYNGFGNPIDFKEYFFEFQPALEPDNAKSDPRAINTLLLSIELPREQRYFFLTATDPEDNAQSESPASKHVIAPGFCAINAATYEAFKYETWKYMKDARANDDAYQQWFARHRANKQVLAEQRERAAHFEYSPLISIVVPCFKSQEQYLTELLDSLMHQSYMKWEAILVDATPDSSPVVKNIHAKFNDARIRYYALPGEGSIVANTNAGIQEARGEFIAFLDHDDILEPDALFCYVEALHAHPHASLFFCDEDLFTQPGHFIQPIFKSTFNIDLLYSHNCITHFLMISRRMMDAIGPSAEEVTGAQDYDLTLRAFAQIFKEASESKTHCQAQEEGTCGQPQEEGRAQNQPEAGGAPQNQTQEECVGAAADTTNQQARSSVIDQVFDRIVHVPRVLYHWREHAESTSGDNATSKPYADAAGKLALQQHLTARGLAAKVESTDAPFVYRVRYDLPATQPRVSIIIPSKDHHTLLEACVHSILERSTYRDLEIVVVENNSTDPETFAAYTRLQTSDARIRVETWQPPSQAAASFNYSALVNFGVAHSSGEYLLLLNNDTEVITPDFIEEMLGYLQRPEVGVVGAKLYFRDHLTQHAGIEVGPYDALVHVNQDFGSKREGYLGRAVRPGNFSAVTGACQMVARKTFNLVGGYDESLAVGFNDADFCLRVRQAGYLTTFTPYAELYHYEFVSRGRETADPTKEARWRRERDLFAHRWPDYFSGIDPYSNPNLARDNAYYALGE